MRPGTITRTLTASCGSICSVQYSRCGSGKKNMAATTTPTTADRGRTNVPSSPDPSSPARWKNLNSFHSGCTNKPYMATAAMTWPMLFRWYGSSIRCKNHRIESTTTQL